MTFGVAQRSTPLQKPTINLPSNKTQKFVTIDIPEATIATILKIIILIRRPFPTKFPPIIEPIVIPMTELVDMQASGDKILLSMKNYGTPTI